MQQQAIDDIKRFCDCKVSEGSKIRIMPDVHAGAGCTIGTTMTLKDRVVPNIVGVDIGCGMLTISLGKIDIDFEKLDRVVHGIPSGMRVWSTPQNIAGKDHPFDLCRLRCYDELSHIDHLNRSLGTLGGGNHFIEVDVQESTGNKYLVIHTGSRNIGYQVAHIYQKRAISYIRHTSDMREVNHLVEQYKSEGRESEIEQAIKDLKKRQKEYGIPDDLCYLEGRDFDEYMQDAVTCQAFARLNRELIATIILQELFPDLFQAGHTWTDWLEGFHTVHNYINPYEKILRKGAIAAHKGEMILIPINMRDGSILALGKGDEEWNYSAPHGAGRIMSRRQAKQTLSLDEYKKAMEGIYTTSVCNGTLDEAPMAYKSLDDIKDVIGETVFIISILKPLYNFKAEE